MNTIDVRRRKRIHNLNMRNQNGSTVERPRITVVTVNYNNRQGLIRTLSSVSEQNFREFEQVVIDGASTDGSVDVIKDPQFRIDRWVSESDHGIYDAMNKGIRMASGEYLLFLNSGDHLLSPDSLRIAAEVLVDRDIYYFSLEVREPTLSKDYKIWIKRFPEKLSLSFLSRDALPHQSSLIKASLFERYGFYDESLEIGSDWKHSLLCVCKHNCTYSYDSRVLGVFYADGLSSHPANKNLINIERQQVLTSEFPAFIEDLETVYIGQEDAAQLKALRASRTVRLLQKLGLLWKF